MTVVKIRIAPWLLALGLWAALAMTHTAVAEPAEGSERLAQESVALLEDRIGYWYERGRPDRIEGVLAQLQRVHPNHPRLLEVQALLALRSGERQAAERLYQQLREQAPSHPATRRLREHVALSESEQELLAEGRMLALAGRFEEARETWQQAFPTAPASPELALEYWQLLARVPATQEQALTELAALAAAQPDALRIEMALLRARVNTNTTTAEDRERLLELAQDRVFGQEALSLLVLTASRLPLAAEHVPLLARAVARHPGDEGLREVYERQRTHAEQAALLAADPAYQRQQRGLQELAADRPEAAERWLRDALPERAHDAELLGGLGLATLRQGRPAEALAWFRRARDQEPATTAWADLVESTTFWRDVQVFDQLHEAGEYRRARIMLERLQSHPESQQQVALIAIRQARLAQAEERPEDAYHYYRQALAAAPESTTAAWALLAHYREQDDPAGLSEFYLGLSPAVQDELTAEYNRLQAGYYQQLAAERLAADDIEGAHEALLSAYDLAPNNPWLVAALAQSDERLGIEGEAEPRFRDLLAQNPSDESWFAYSLFLSRQEQPGAARDALANVPAENRTEGMSALALRLDEQRLLDAFTDDWRQVLSDDPELMAEVRPGLLVPLLSRMVADAGPADQSYLAQVEVAVERQEPEFAAALLADASAFAAATRATEQSRAWSVAAIAAQRQDVDTDIWRDSAIDDWRVAGLRQRARDAIAETEKVLYIGYEHSNRSGTEGITALDTDTLMLDLRVPFAERDGYWQVRVDPTRIRTGTADLTNNFWRNRLGTGLLCSAEEPECPDEQLEPITETGVAVGVGADFEDWWFDIGRSPVGFQRSEWLGGLGYRGSVGDFGVRLTLERRIQTATLTSFAGREDPFSHAQWGPVVRQGLGLGTSWDQGGRFGWWGNAGYEHYSGHNVATNQRWYAYTGGYMRAYNTEPLAVTLGLTTLFWGFNEDLSGTTLGHGNYYSPERYQSVSLPVTVFGRVNRLSYLLRGSVGYSDTQLHAAPFFPAHPELQEQAVSSIEQTGVEPFYPAGTGGGRSHSLTGQLEYQLSRHWYIGARASLVRSDTFSPNQGLIYLRYHFGGHNLPVARPPDPPERYVDR